jgi:hypothetical protein
MDDATRKTLKSLRRTRTPAQMRALFKAVRARSDAELLAEVTPPKKHPAPKADFAAKIAARLSVIQGPASDKADALIGIIEETHGAIDIAARGLVPVIRTLARRFGEKAVTAATSDLLARLEASGSMRERVT